MLSELVSFYQSAVNTYVISFWEQRKIQKHHNCLLLCPVSHFLEVNKNNFVYSGYDEIPMSKYRILHITSSILIKLKTAAVIWTIEENFFNFDMI